MKTVILVKQRRWRTGTKIIFAACLLQTLGIFVSAQHPGDGDLQFAGQSVYLSPTSTAQADQGQAPKPPIPLRSSSNMLATQMCFDNSGFGMMFDVEAISNVLVENLETNLGSAASHNIEIYFKSGSHVGFENNAAAWTFLGSAVGVASNGADSLTLIPIDLDVTITAGNIAAFYIAVTSAVPNPIGHPSHLLYTDGTTLNAVFVADNNLILKEGTALGVPSVMPFEGGLYEPRQLNGAIHYSLCSGIDLIPPVAICLPTVNVPDCALGFDPSVTGLPVVSDNLDPYPYVSWEDVITTVSTCPVVMTVARTFTVEDLCGNSSTCFQLINVLDEQPPSLDCPPDVTVDISESSQPPETGMVYSVDACSMQPFIEWTDVITTSSNCLVVEIIERNWESMDDCGNVATCLQSVTVAELLTPPTITCVPVVSVSCDELGDLINMGIVSAVDCGPVDLTYTDLAAAFGTCPAEQTLLRTWVATDEQGNTSSCQQTIDVFDDTPPMLVQCQSPEDISCTDKDMIGFNAFAEGAIVSSIVQGALTIDVTAYSKGGILQDAVVFNTADPTAGDTDLGTPNTFFGGPGISDNTADGYELTNNRAVGHVLVVQNPATYPEPDDYFLSDSIVFEFSEPTFLESITLVDIETPQALMGAGAWMYDADGQVIAFVPFAGGDDNNIEDVCLMTPGVSKLAVYYGNTLPASGGVAGFTYFEIDDEIEDVAFVDNCGGDVTLVQSQSFVWSGCSATLINTVTAVDACGNTSPESCVQQIPVNPDFIAPEITPPPDLTIGCNDVLPPPDVGGVLALDNVCPPMDITIEYVNDVVEGTGCAAVTKRIYSAMDPCGNQSLGTQFIYRQPAVLLDAKLILLGATDGINPLMNTSLNDLLPYAQPYLSIYGYNGSEEMPFVPSNIVDWVFLELLDPVTDTVVAQRAALVREDGEVTDTDGISDVVMLADTGQYKVVVRHRNHLDIITENTIDFSSGSATCDFTSGASSALGMHQLPDGEYAMINGDINGDHVISYNGADNDKNVILALVGLNSPNNTIPGYHIEDVNMDGTAMYNGSANDKNVILSLVGLESPNSAIIGQLHE